MRTIVNRQPTAGKRTLRLVLILCLGLGLVAGAVWAQSSGFHLTPGNFSQAGTGAEPLASNSYRMHASVGQPGPPGNASSESFGLSSGYQLVPVAPAQRAIYLPLTSRHHAP